MAYSNHLSSLSLAMAALPIFPTIMFKPVYKYKVFIDRDALFHNKIMAFFKKSKNFPEKPCSHQKCPYISSMRQA